MVIEIATFRLADAADEDAFLDADAILQAHFAYQRPGIVRRTTASGSDGEWLVLTFWDTENDAEEAASAFGDHPATRDFRRLIDESSYTVRRYSTLD